jgi:cysteine desulfurase
MRIYLDYNATTPVDKEVLQVLHPFLNEYFGNPSSVHSFGVETKIAVENARKQVAALINCQPHEIIFTSGGTESNNFAIKGYAFAHEQQGKHIITSAIEHPAVTEVCRYLESRGFQVSYILVDEYGMVILVQPEAAITPQTILISVMHANNEIGTIQPGISFPGMLQMHAHNSHIGLNFSAQFAGLFPQSIDKTWQYV